MKQELSPEDYGTTEPTIAEVCQQLNHAEGDQFGDVISQLMQSLTALEAKLNSLPEQEQEVFIQRSQAELNAVSARPSALAWLRRANKMLFEKSRHETQIYHPFYLLDPCMNNDCMVSIILHKTKQRSFDLRFVLYLFLLLFQVNLTFPISNTLWAVQSLSLKQVLYPAFRACTAETFDP